MRVRAEDGLGKINAEGLQREGNSYVNDDYRAPTSPSKSTSRAASGRSTWRLCEVAWVALRSSGCREGG